MARDKALIIGCGSLGSLIASKLDQSGFEVVGAKRDTLTLAKHITPLAIDVNKYETLIDLMSENWSVVFVTLTADEFNYLSYKKTYVDGLRNVVKLFNSLKNNLPLILFASSTAVYSQQNSEWVTEKSKTKPEHFSGRVMLKAEEILSTYKGTSTSVRLSGIYGRNKSRYLSQLKKGLIASKTPIFYSNRIHIEDCSRVFLHLFRMYEQKQTLSSNYIASDCDSAPLHEVMSWLASKYGIDVETLTEFIPEYKRGNKRCSNSLLLETGFKFRYPSFKDGMIS